jgi:chemotaxis protein MotB
LANSENIYILGDSMKLLGWRSVILFGCANVFSSCVAVQKFDEMESLKNAQTARADSLERIANLLTRRVTMLDANITERALDTSQLHALLDARATSLDSIMRVNRALNEQSQAMAGNYNALKASSTRDAQKLLASLEQAQRELQTRETTQRDAQREGEKKLTDLQRDLQGREQRLKDVEQKLQARDAAVKALRTRIADALLNFKEGELDVALKDGKVYVSLSNKLLFASGSTEIEKQGKAALKQLAQALNKQTEVSITVEGHTDDAKITNLGTIKDNWDLSAMRAIEVIRFLTNDGKVDPKRITGAARAEYSPIEAGSTPEARAKNRRTDIILTPRLDELFQMLEKR